MSITRTAIAYERDHIGEALVINETERRWFREPDVTTRTYARCWHEQLWRGEDGHPVGWPFSHILTGLREQWEHDRPTTPAEAYAAGQEAGRVAAARAHANATELFECDCGRAHPAGWICNSTWRDTL